MFLTGTVLDGTWEGYLGIGLCFLAPKPLLNWSLSGQGHVLFSETQQQHLSLGAPHQSGGSLSGLGVGTPGPSHSLLALWGPLSVELETKRPRAGFFCTLFQTGRYGEAGYKGREVLVIMAQKHPLAKMVISLDGDLADIDFQLHQSQVLWTRVNASDPASLDLGGSRNARGSARAASGPAERSSFADTGLPGCWSLARETLRETEGARL